MLAIQLNQLAAIDEDERKQGCLQSAASIQCCPLSFAAHGWEHHSQPVRTTEWPYDYGERTVFVES